MSQHHMGFFSTTELSSSFKKPLSALHSSYKYIKLENGLRTLLVSDPKCTVTSAAMCVGAGSHSDPDDLPGLAHFCEHMLFMGTVEFPNPNDFRSKLSSMGGNANAYTMGDYTCVYFEVPMTDTLAGDELGLNYLMKNFSSFFKRPLFTESYMNMEVNSVDNEHEGNVVNDEKILYHGWRLLSSEDHPFHRFGTGTKSTLNSKCTQKEMIKYYKANFVSTNMVLALKSPLSLNQLQKLAVTNFASIPEMRESIGKPPNYKRRSKTKPRDSPIIDLESLDVRSEIFPSTCTGRLLYIKSDNASQVRLFFPIHKFVNTFYESVWCSLLGDESLGSLCDYLKRVKKWVTSMYVYIQSLSKGNKIFVMDFEILKSFNLEEVIHIVQSFVDQILNSKLTDLGVVLREYSRVFKYQAYFSESEATTVMEEASNYALCLMENRFHDLENLVMGDSYIFDGNVNDFAIKTMELFDILSLNAICLCNDADWKGLTPANLIKDPYYRFIYGITSLHYSPLRKAIPSFFILQRNPFITMTHQELDHQMKNSRYTKPYLLETTNKIPKLIDYSMFHEIWHLTSNSFNVAISLHMCFSNIENTPLSLVAIELIAEYIGQELKIFFYQAEMAQFSWGIFANLVTTPSLAFEIRGPLSGLLYFLKEFIVRVENLISSFNLDYRKFVAMKLQMRRNYDALEHGETNAKIVAASVMALEQGVFGIDDRLEAVELLETSYLAHVCDLILHDFKHIDILVTGGDRQFAMDACKVINIITSHEKIHLAKRLFTFASSINLKTGRNYDLMLENLNVNDPNDVVYYYIQLCSRKDEKRIVGQFLAYHMNQFVRYQLRTRKQIGYLILSGIRFNKLTIGLYILVNSASYDFYQILLEIELVVFEWEVQVLTMTEDQLKQQLKSFLKKQDQEESDTIPSNISAATKPIQHSDNFTSTKQHLMLFESITTKNYDFENCRNGLSSAQLNTNIKLAEVIEFFKKHVSIKSTHRTTLSILVSSKKGKMKKEFEENKEILKSLIGGSNYLLTSLQLSTLLRESSNDISIVIQRLKNIGYNISTKHSRGLHKILYATKGYKAGNSKEQARLKQMCVAKYGEKYLDNQRVLPRLRVRNVAEIHNEAASMRRSDHLTQLREIFDCEDEDT